MGDPGRQLREYRKRLRLRYRDVEEASQEIARLRGNQEYAVGLSRLADIENRGTLPSIYRLYSLCAIYGLSFEVVMGWYSVALESLPADSARLKIRHTRNVNFEIPKKSVSELPLEAKGELDLRKSIYLNPVVKRWGRLPLALLAGLDLKKSRFAFIGTEDWFMYPLIPPGSFVQIDESRKQLLQEGEMAEHERPIHLVEHRTGFRCGWCTQRNGSLIVQPPSGSEMLPELFRLEELDIVGQVVAVAKRLDLGKVRRKRS